MTITCFAAVPIAGRGGQYLIKDEPNTYRHAMGVLVLLNLIIFTNENTKTFLKKPIFVFSDLKRLITVAIALILWAAVVIVTVLFKGRELVWLIWISFSLCISGYQVLYIILNVIIEARFKRGLVLKAKLGKALKAKLASKKAAEDAKIQADHDKSHDKSGAEENHEHDESLADAVRLYEHEEL
jgi:hypothetical protein